MRFSIGFLFLVIIVSCTSVKTSVSKVEYPRHVGDLIKDSIIDLPTFNSCNGDSLIAQYFNYSNGFPLIREKRDLEIFFEDKYIPVNLKTQNGRIRIRFIVNCLGKSGRFRILEGDENYNKFKFDNRISNQLLNLTKEINDWRILKDNNDTPIDYYMYLTFIIEDGYLKDILP